MLLVSSRQVSREPAGAWQNNRCLEAASALVALGQCSATAEVGVAVGDGQLTAGLGPVVHALANSEDADFLDDCTLDGRTWKLRRPGFIRMSSGSAFL